MNQIKKTAVILIILFSFCFWLGYLTGKNQAENALYEPIKEENTILKAEKHELQKELVQLKLKRYHENRYFEERINAMYGSSTYINYKKLIQSIDTQH